MYPHRMNRIIKAVPACLEYPADLDSGVDETPDPEH